MPLRSSSRRPWSFAPARPGWRTHAVRADAPLGETLRAHGIAADGVHSGTRLTLAWSATHVELWRADGDVMLSRAWRDVRGIRRSFAAVGWGRPPAVALIIPGAAQPPPPPPPRARAKRVPVSEDGDVRWIDVELSEALLRRTRHKRSLVLGPDERAAPVTEHWSQEEVAEEVRRIFYEMPAVPRGQRLTLTEEFEGISEYLRTQRPEVASMVGWEMFHDHCFENR